jgi:hypothetical protein
MRGERPLSLAALQHQGWQMNVSFGPFATSSLEVGSRFFRNRSIRY